LSSASQGLIDVRLTAIRYAAKDTNLYEFRPLDGQPLPSTDPGAHIDIHLPNKMMRQYSLVSSGLDPRSYVVGIKRDPGSRGGSVFIHDQLKVGSVLKISQPRNNFNLVESAPHTILVAGGIGITPLYCMSQRLGSLGRPWHLYYSCRSRSEAAFLEELSYYDCVTFNFDEENGGTYLDLAAIVAQAPKDAHIYCCGPLPMLRAFEEATKSFPSHQVHVEYFTAQSEVATEGGFILELARSKREVAVAKGQSILEALRACGIDITYSCEEGVCGACETTVLSGTPDHRDSILTESERQASKTMMVCCSGSKSDRLVLDL
jgi:ferredoxin-NADP reductase